MCKDVISKYGPCCISKISAISDKCDCYLIAYFDIAVVCRIITAYNQACNVKRFIIYYSYCAVYTCTRVSCRISVCSVCIVDSRAYITSINGTSFNRTVIRGIISRTAIRCIGTWITKSSVHKYRIICISDQLYCRRYCIDKHV